VAAGESVLLVTDGVRPSIAEAFAAAAGELAAVVAIDRIPLGERSGAEPPAETAAKMAAADVALLLTEASLSWTNARRAATDGGPRVASTSRFCAEL
jgi:hypothetical protein